MRIRSILLFLIFMIILVNPSAAQDSPIIPDSSHISMRLQNISKHESSGDSIIDRIPPNISMEDIKLRKVIAPELPTILTPSAAKYHGPVGIFLDSVEGENIRNQGRDFFAPYILEILAHAGIPYALVSRNELVSTEITYPVLVLSHPTSFSANEIDSISRYVNEGGTIVTLGGTSGLESILGVTAAPTHYDEGFLNVTATDGSILRSPLPLHVFSITPALPTSAISLARFLDTKGMNTGFSAVTRNSFGMGQAWYIAPDLAVTVVKIQQGIPIVKDGVPAPDETAPVNDKILRSEDGIVLNWTKDRTSINGTPLFLEPISDHLKEMFLGLILDVYRRDDARLPLVWYWPGNQDAVAALSHDTDRNLENLARFMLHNMTTLGINSTWCFIRYPETYPISLFRDIANAGGETSLHYDALGYRSDTTWSEANFRSQLSWLENKTGLNVTTNKNHYGRWEGWVDFYRWNEAAGIEADQSKHPTFSGNSGFLFGTSHPYFPIDDSQHNNRFIGVLAINMLTTDLIAKQPYSFGPALVDKSLQHFGIAHFIFHPTYINKTSVAISNLVNYSMSKGMQFWTIDQINKWERTRRNIVFTNISNEGFNIMSPVDVDQVTMLIPLKNDTDNLQVFINGSPISWHNWSLYGAPTARFTKNISKGVTRVDFHIIDPVYNTNKGLYYTTIQAAIDDASPGDEIHVDSGTYYENVNVNKQLTLRGIGMPVVDANGSGSAIKLSANGITLNGFTAIGGGYDYDISVPDAGITVTSNYNTLINWTAPLRVDN